jgi:predicted metalloprotease with PDZ domain
MKKQHFLFLFLLCAMQLTWAKYDYTLRWDKPNTHLYLISLTTEPQTESYTDFQIATWRPGRYIDQDYAAAVSNFVAQNGDGTALKFVKINKNTWRVSHPKTAKIQVNYGYYANNEDAGSSFYTDGQVYFNPINCFMYVSGKWNDAVTLNIPDLPKDWKAATALTPVGSDGKNFSAGSFHEFADCPSVFSNKMKTLSFTTQGATFRLHFQGNYKGDATTDSVAVKNMRKIVAEQGAIFGGFPFKEFHFIYRLVESDIHHAVEHANSTSVALPSKVSESAEAIKGILNISSHEFWHVWNVKRIRPASLLPYDYNEEQFTGLHWFTEGVTEYYSALTNIRAGVVTREDGLAIFAKSIQSLENNYAYSVISPYYSSYDSWLSPSAYSQPHLRNSFYVSGQILGLLIDLQIRTQSKGEKSLDDVFRYMYKEYGSLNKGLSEDGVQKAIEAVTGNSWKDFFENYVYGNKVKNYSELLAASGLSISMTENADNSWEKLGIMQPSKSEQGWFVKKIHPASDAYTAGIGLGDLITEINGETADKFAEGVFFNSLKKGQNITLKYLNAQNNQYTTTFAFTGKGSPKVCTLSIPTENKIVENWLKSQAK